MGNVRPVWPEVVGITGFAPAGMPGRLTTVALSGIPSLFSSAFGSGGVATTGGSSAGAVTGLTPKSSSISCWISAAVGPTLTGALTGTTGCTAPGPTPKYQPAPITPRSMRAPST